MKYFLIIAFIFCAGTASSQTDTTRKEFLGILTLTEKFKEEKNWTPETQKIVGEHFQRLLKNRKEGVVVIAGPTDYQVNNPDMMGVVIFYAKDEKEAHDFMQQDPAVRNNIMHAKVHPFKPAVR